MILDLVSQPIHGSVFAGFFNIPVKSGCEKLERRFGASRRLRTDDGPTTELVQRYVSGGRCPTLA